MTFKLKDPGSAITHFIGMMMALLATIPLLVKAAREPDWLHLIAYRCLLSVCFFYILQVPPTIHWISVQR